MFLVIFGCYGVLNTSTEVVVLNKNDIFMKIVLIKKILPLIAINRSITTQKLN